MAEKSPDPFRENPIFLTARAALALSTRCRKALKGRGVDDLSPAQLGILAALEEKDGMTPSQLARAAKYEKSTLTPMLEKLEAAALVVRTKDPKDGRLQRLYITKQGRRRRRAVERVLEDVTRALLDGVARKTLKHHVAFCEAVLDVAATDAA
jgi:DNA-binding MarR family transcriptional regulator